MDTLYTIHNVAQSRFNRTARAAVGTAGRRKQHVLGGQHRIVKQRPVTITGADLLLHLDELKEKTANHLIEVRTLEGGLLVDLNLLKIVEAPEVTPPLPHPPLDSVNNDSPHVGEKIPLFPEGAAVGDTVVPSAAQEREDAEEEEEVPPPDAQALSSLPGESGEQEYVEQSGSQKKGKGRRR